LPQSIGVRRPNVMSCWSSCEENEYTHWTWGKQVQQCFMLDPNDGFVAVDVLLRQEPDDEEDDEDEENRSHDADEDDDYGNYDGYSERASARVIDSIGEGPRRLFWEAQNYIFSSTAT
jgi:hypothetical protein